MDHIASNVAQSFAVEVDGKQDPEDAQHLVVLIHGLWGNPVHLTHLRDTMIKAHANSGIYVLIPKSNKDSNTYDGIEVGAERITYEVEETIKQLRDAGAKKLSKISVCGYSLGGLVSRYVVGLLYKNGVFEDLTPMNFTTFATPHIGVRTPRLGYGAQTWNFLGSRTLSTSGQQMFLTDNFRDTGRPLLSILADSNSIFVRGLSKFQRKSVYANTINDRSVPYYTSAISRVDPFVDLEAIDVHPLADQEDSVILDPENPVSPRKPEVKDLTFRERYVLSDKTRDSLPFYAFVFTFLPLAVPLFMVNAGYQTYKSAQRVRLHEEGKAIDLKRYRIPLLEKAQMAEDRMMQRFADERTHHSETTGSAYLPTPPPENSESEPAAQPVKHTKRPSISERGSSLIRIPSAPKEATINAQQAKNDTPWPTLALTDEQFEMIDNLDAHVGFVKYPVHIQKVRHTHAAIVVRMQKESFSEGHAVSSHWVKNFVV